MPGEGVIGLFGFLLLAGVAAAGFMAVSWWLVPAFALGLAGAALFQRRWAFARIQHEDDGRLGGLMHIVVETYAMSLVSSAALFGIFRGLGALFG